MPNKFLLVGVVLDLTPTSKLLAVSREARKVFLSYSICQHILGHLYQLLLLLRYLPNATNYRGLLKSQKFSSLKHIPQKLF